MNEIRLSLRARARVDLLKKTRRRLNQAMKKKSRFSLLMKYQSVQTGVELVPG